MKQYGWYKKKHFQRLKRSYVAFFEQPKQLIFVCHLSVKKGLMLMRFRRLDCSKGGGGGGGGLLLNFE
jgi:hypothetical protein